MKDHRRGEILRLRAAALLCIFTRSLTCFGYWRCRIGRCLRSCFARSSRWPSCKPVRRRSLQTLHQVSTSIGFRGLAKPHSTDQSRVCLTLSDSVPNPSTGRHGHTEQGLPPRTSSLLLGTVSRNILRALSSCCLARGTFQATIQCVSPTMATRPSRVLLPPRDVFPTRASSIESDLPLRLVLAQLQQCFDC